MEREDLFEGELYVASGYRHPVVLQVQRYGDYGKQLGLWELTSSRDSRRHLESGPMSLTEAIERYGMVWPIWRYASIQRESGPPPEVAVEDLTSAPPTPIRAAFDRVAAAARRRPRREAS